jgi:uncharacterized protein (TIGR02246 family)
MDHQVGAIPVVGYLKLLLVLFCFSAPALAQSSADRAEILKTFDSWDQGWAERDPELAVSDYAEDADWTNAFGDRFVGKEKLLEGLTFIFSLDFVMSGTSAENEFTDITFVKPDVAIVRSKLVRTGQRTSEGDVMPDRHINHLRIYEKRDGRWQVISHLISQAHDKR